MIRLGIFKKFLIPGAVVVGSIGLQDDGISQDAEGKRLNRSSDLPIYGDECYICGDKPCDDPSALEAKVGRLRKELWVWVDKYKGYRQQVKEVCSIGLAHTESMLETLREESNYLPRAGAIGLSGLTGFVFGLRGGVIRRVTYGSVGATAMAAFCYPRQAAEYTQETLPFVKKYVKIGYNFIYGVKPDYIKMPEPSTFLTDGADVPKSSSSSSSVDAPVVDSPPPPPPPTSSERAKTPTTKRDQSRPEDKDLYSTRSSN